MNNQRISNLAIQVRRKCLKFAMSKKAQDYCFWGHEDLECMCLSASQILKKALKLKGVSSSLFEWTEPGFGHVWLQIGKAVVDITHSQFSHPDIIIAKNPNIANEIADFRCYDEGERMTKDNILDWPDSQRLSNKEIDNILKLRV